MAGVKKMLHRLRQKLQSLSGGDNKEVSNEDMSNEMNTDILMNHKLGLSRKVSKLSSEGGNIEELMRRGELSYNQFADSGDIEEANKAIECWGSVLLVTSDPEARRVAALSNLGCAYYSRFERLGELGDLSNAIECGTQAVSLTPDGDPDKPGDLNNLGNWYLARFERRGETPDLYKAIECGVQAVSLISDDHVLKPSILNSLGNSYLSRFERLGEVADLNKAIECGVQAVSLTLNDHPVKPSRLSNLGNAYRTRFGRLGEVADLNKAVECGAQAVSLAPEDHAAKPTILNYLGISYLTRFERLGEVADLNNSIGCELQADSLTPGNHAVKPSILNSLGNSYRTRFRRLGEVEDLNKAIECGVRAVSLTSDDHADKPGILNNLGNSYHTQFQRLGEVADLNKAIECGARAVSLTPDNHAIKPTRLNNLGNSYLTRFERLGEVADLNKAIEYGAEAVSLTPEDHTVKPGIFNNLAISYVARFEQLGEVADLSKAIDCGAQAVSLTPEDHAVKPGLIDNLGNLYLTRFERLGEVADLNKAIECGKQAVSLISDDRSVNPNIPNNLGISYRTRFEHLGEVEDLNKAIECGLQAVSVTPDSHADKPTYLNNLGKSYQSQFSQLRVLGDLNSAIAAHRAAAESLVGSPSTLLEACSSWARLASRHSVSSPYAAYLRAMHLLPQLVWIGNTVDRRYSLIQQLGDFATEAAAFAISIGNLELALEWLEAGRSIVWGQAAQLRTPFELLSSKDPGLASRLKVIGHQLEREESRFSVTPPSEVKDADLGIPASSHIQLALEWDMLLKQARSISGFEDFLQPPKSNLLVSAAKFHPIAIINVHKSRCDALILQPNNSNVSHVPLTELSATSVMDARKRLVSQVRQRKIGHLASVGSLEKSLHDLCSSVLHPILDFLGYTSKHSIEELPRLTWCTTGLLSFLPLHAAGCYDGTHCNAMDRVISSYTPTLSALLARQPATLDMHCGILAVGQENTPGLDSLPCTKDELAVIAKHASKDRYLQLENDESTVEHVLDAMDQFSWVHMACHGSQDTTDPTHSAFHLHDGKLTLADITKKSFTNKGLAFLSACQTATGDKSLPEEAVHLAAGMLMAGFPSVIGTMWSIADEDGPKIADKVYASLLKDGKMDHTNAARALHEAVVELRAAVGERSFERWAPFIHIGC